MMRILLLVAVALCSSFSEISFTGDEEIRWTDRHELTFSDFNGNVPDNTPWAALTSSYIYFTYGTTNGKLSSFKVYASFKKNESWMKKQNDDVLKHEQLHFDITEVFARKLYQEAEKLESQSGDIPKQATVLFRSINAQCDSTQQQYDNETTHGTKTEEQAAWKKKVNEMLAQYEPYPDNLK